MASPLSALSNSDLNDWKTALLLDETGDRIQLGDRIVPVQSAVEFYKSIVDKTKALKSQTNNASPQELVKTLETALPELVFPERLRSALDKLRSDLQCLDLLESPEGASNEAKPSAAAKEDVRDEEDQSSAALPPGIPAGIPPNIPQEHLAPLLSWIEKTKRKQQAFELEIEKTKRKQQAFELEIKASQMQNDVCFLATNVFHLTDGVNRMLDWMASLSPAQDQIQDTDVVREESQVQETFARKAGMLYGDDHGLTKNVKPPPLDSLSKLVSVDSCMVPRESSFHVQALLARWQSFDENTKRMVLELKEVYDNFIRTSVILDRPDNTQSRASKQRAAPPHMNTRAKKRRRDGQESETDSPILSLEEYMKLVARSTKELASRLDRVLEGKEPSATSEGTYFPGPRYQEIHGAQPFFSCLLSAIARVCEKTQARQFYETSKDGKPEAGRSYRSGQAIDTKPASFFEDHQQHPTVAKRSPRESNGSERAESQQASTSREVLLGIESAAQGPDGKFQYGDVSITKDGRHVWIYRPDTTPILIEIKALFGGQKDERWDLLESSTVYHILNHLSSYVRVSFDFAGAGAPSHATGVVGSLAYVQVYRLELRNPGTENVELKMVKSERLPLMSLGAFTKWSKANPRAREDDRINGAEEALFPKERYREGHAAPTGHAATEGATAPESDSKEDVTPKGDSVLEGDFNEDTPPPLGFLALFELFRSSKSSTFGPASHLNAIELPLGVSDTPHSQFFGRGSFGYVFSRGDSGILKIPRYGRASFLKAELCAYKAVGQAREDLDQVKQESELCRYLAVSELRIANWAVRVGSTIAKIPSLRITPKGKPLLHFGDVSENQPFLCKMVFDVALALKHMHSRSVAHNDVSLSNVVVVRGEDEPHRAVLVDLSLACPFSFEIPSFQGNPVYAHRDIHKDKPWSPRPFHDMAALGFLAAILASGSVVPWRSFRTVMSSDDSYTYRLDVALAALDELLSSSVEEHTQQDIIQIKNWVEFDENKTVRCCPTNCKSTVSCTNNGESLPLFSAPRMEDINYDRHHSAMVESED